MEKVFISCLYGMQKYTFTLEKADGGQLKIGDQQYDIVMDETTSSRKYTEILQIFRKTMDSGGSNIAHLKNWLEKTHVELVIIGVNGSLPEILSTVTKLIQTPCIEDGIWDLFNNSLQNSSEFTSMLLESEKKMIGRPALNIRSLSTIYTSNQDRYSTLLWGAIDLGSQVRQKYHLTFAQMLTFCASMRQKIANLLGVDCWQSYGHPRWLVEGCGMITSVKGVYSAIPQKLAEKYPEYQDHKTHYTTVVLNGEKIPLTIVPIKNDIPFLQHTEKAQISCILAHVETLYNRALESTDPEEITTLLGEIFWWICQGKPWILGDPSIAEILIRSIWEEKGLENPPWNASVVPWIETVVEIDPKAFGREFTSLFQ